MYGFEKSTFSARSGVSVKFASVTSTLFDASTSTRAAGSTDVYTGFTPRPSASAWANSMS